MVTFETKVWEKDWEYILKGDYLEKMISSNNFTFGKRHVIINNVANKKLVEEHCQRKVDQGIIDHYYAVEDYENEVLNHFGLTKEDFKGGYYYSIAELVGIYKCETEFLLHYSGDSFLRNDQHHWIEKSLEIMNADKNIFVANPTWNDKFKEAKKEATNEVENFYIGYGFSDQCYLVRRNDFMNGIYNEQNQFSERYPKYGGELFEKRVDAYMRNHNKMRITHKLSSYISSNFPRNWFSRKVISELIIQNRINKMDAKKS